MPGPYPPPPHNWLILTHDAYHHETGFVIIVTTDVPANLTLRWSLVQPQIHNVPRFKRGAAFSGERYFCFVAYHDQPQNEAGDTLTHTFYLINWPYCETRWYYFYGTRSAQPCRSSSALFRRHNMSLPPYYGSVGFGVWGRNEKGEPPWNNLDIIFRIAGRTFNEIYEFNPDDLNPWVCNFRTNTAWSFFAYNKRKNPVTDDLWTLADLTNLQVGVAVRRSQPGGIHFYTYTGRLMVYTYDPFEVSVWRPSAPGDVTGITWQKPGPPATHYEIMAQNEVPPEDYNLWGESSEGFVYDLYHIAAVPPGP